ncbi:DUF4296 domain-containing protein [Polluticoccus soli]|uniref:DUF4296 domain-containing protein n=1 Tax=Polluticoccus soli TaxID=3034150 RepID=UPI0023E3512F|nr:DUF4296 domain-containing protein [Flavipsychrobacter sp. JY13-12]
MKASYLVLPLLLLFSCKSWQKDEPPLPPAKMKQIFLDLHLAEAYSSMLDDTLHQSRNKDIDSLAVFYTDVFAHHNVTREQFVEGVNWYKQHPEVMDTFYKSLIDDATKLEGRYIK